jgi:hypothetical protein
MIKKLEIITVDTSNYPLILEVGSGKVKEIIDYDKEYRIVFKDKEWILYKRFIKEAIVYYG